MLRCALVLGLVTSSGCALLASANAHHNSGGTACLSSSAFGIVDLVVAGVSAAAIGTSDASAGYYTVPVVFGLSGLAGVISAQRCTGEDSEASASNAPPASNSAPSFGNAWVDPEARDATREEMGVEPLVTPTKPLPAITQEPAKPPPTPAPAPTLSVCSLSPRVDCPEHYYCKLVAENRGECVAMD
jgi:D-aminopeptidase